MADLQQKSLGKVKGLCAYYSEATLNGRPYDKIYKDILAGKNYFYNEMLKRGGIFCEFGHPSQTSADFERTDTDLEKACVLIQKITETKKGELTAEGIILDTPAGRIYKAVAPFYKFGFSSRGSYEADPSSNEGPDGWNQDSYIFKGFDIVALPANEGSAISVTESIKGKKHISAREALDLNQIADAADVDEEEVESELDKLFDTDGEVANAKRVNLRDIKKDKEEGADMEEKDVKKEGGDNTEDTTEDEKELNNVFGDSSEDAENEGEVAEGEVSEDEQLTDEGTDSTEENLEETDVDNEGVEDASGVEDEPMSEEEQTAVSAGALLKDLQKALKEKHDLSKLMEQLSFEKQTKDAQVVELTSKITKMTEQLQKVASELNNLKKEAASQIDGMVGSYNNVIAENDAKVSMLNGANESLKKELSNQAKKNTELKASLETYKQAIAKNKVSFESLKQKYSKATEELSKMSKTVSATESVKAQATEKLSVELKTQKSVTEKVVAALKRANESLIQMTANMFDIDAKVLTARLPKVFSPIQLRSAAESMAAELSRYASYSTPSVIPTTFVDKKEQEENLASLLGLEG
jgi:hypothetical protein